MKILVLDTETSGFINPKLGASHDNQAWVVEIGAAVIDQSEDEGWLLGSFQEYIFPDGREITPGALEVHGYDKAFLVKHGHLESYVVEDFNNFFEKHSNQINCIVGHNIDFDMDMLAQLFTRTNTPNTLLNYPRFCTMKNMVDVCKLPGKKRDGNKFKYPNLGELYRFLFNENMDKGFAHTALGDAMATARCFMSPVVQGVFKKWILE